MFFDDVVFDFFPINAKRRIGEHVIECGGIELIVRQGIAQLDVADLLAFDQHVGFADGVAFGIELLTKGDGSGLWIELVDVFHPRRQEATRTRGWVIDGADDVWLGQYFIIFHKDQRGCQPHDIAWGKVFTCGVVGTLCKASDQLFKD